MRCAFACGCRGPGRFLAADAHPHTDAHAFPFLPTQETFTCTELFCLLVFIESRVWGGTPGLT